MKEHKSLAALFMVIVVIPSALVAGCAVQSTSHDTSVVKPEPCVHSAKFNILLKAVERPIYAKERYGESRVTNIEEGGILKNHYEDEMVSIVWSVSVARLAFVLRNKTSHSIHIPWDEASFVDENGLSHKVIHSGIKYDDRYTSQPPTVVVREGFIEDMILPSDNVYLQEKSESQRNMYEMIRIKSGRIRSLEQEKEDLEVELALAKVARIDGQYDSWCERPFFPILGILDEDRIAIIKAKAGKSQRPLDEVAYEELASWTYDQVEKKASEHIRKTIQVLLPLKIEGIVNEYIFIFEVRSVEVTRGIELKTLLGKVVEEPTSPMSSSDGIVYAIGFWAVWGALFLIFIRVKG